MDLTPGNKKRIDEMEYDDLLYFVRYAPAGDPWFSGETGTYWLERMKKLRDAGADHVGASKRIGWD